MKGRKQAAEGETGKLKGEQRGKREEESEELEKDEKGGR